LAAYYLTGVLLKTDRTDDAIAVYKEYLSHEPDDEGAMSQLVTLLVSVDEYDEAHKLAERLVQLNPEDEGHRSLLVMVEQLEEGGELDPSVLEGQLQQGKPEAAH
jgi:tetratricopeptide (TPR) repeat protein